MIYKKCIMTIRNNKATLDEDIYLYRLDKNIELHFIIVNNKYKFDKSDLNNIIAQTNAAYFQIRLYKNDDIKYTFAIQATEDAKAILKITDDLIDDPIEVGEYDFQISLLDEEKTSMISMPIVSKQLHVCEPLVSDDATMGKAILGLSKLATGEIKNAFDSEGNYIREIHQDGDILSASIINKFEEALDTNTKAIKNGTGGTGTSYDDTAIKNDIANIKNDLGTAQLTTTAKDVKGAVNEVAAQYKDIAKKTIIEGGKIYLAKSDGTKLDEGTTLPISIGTVTSNSIETYKCEDIGEIVAMPSDYVAWGAGNLRFDKSLDKFVILLYCAPTHTHTTADLYVSYIDKNNLTASEPVKCKFLANDGSTDITPAKAGVCSFLILSDGTYITFQKSSADSLIHKYISSDNGVTWISTTDTISAPFTENLWNMFELSNGRLLASDDYGKRGIMYSDDKGVTWTAIQPAPTGDDLSWYEAEYFVLEVEENKLIAIGRMAGDHGKEPAVITFSNDNGNTWSKLKYSTSITDMSGSCCTGLVHDGIVELFVCSRWYTGTEANTNTGKFGAIYHFSATIENALKDNFTCLGIVDYAKGSVADDYHAPCVAIDDDNKMLLSHMDKGLATSCAQRFIRGELGGLSYVASDGSKSPAKAYSAKYTEILFQNMLDKINYLQYKLSQISGSGVKPPSGTLIWTYDFDASTAENPLCGSTSDAMYPYSTWSRAGSGGTNTGTFATNETLNQRVLNSNQPYLLITPTKSNFAIETKVGEVSGDYGRAIGIVSDGKFYGFCTNHNDVIMNGWHTYKIIKNGSKITVELDGNSVKDDGIVYSKIGFESSNYGTPDISTGNYVFFGAGTWGLAISTFKYGEWNS